MSAFEAAVADAESGFGDRPVGCPLQSCRQQSQSKATVSGNRIDIEFDPAKSKKITKCDKIVHVQFIRMFVDGAAINPGDFASYFEYRRGITTAKGWYVDLLASETSPDYQQGNGVGKKNDSGSTKATMMDQPSVPDGGDKGFYNKTTNPTGSKRLRFDFITYAWCMAGPDCGKWYEGMSWSYEKTYKDFAAGRPGKSKVTSKNIAADPSKDQIDAFDKFNSVRGFSPCP